MRITAHLFGLFLLFSVSVQAAPPEYREQFRQLEDEWSHIFYEMPEKQQAERFKDLLPRVHALAEQYPALAEPLVLEGIVLCTYAGAEIGLSSLHRVEQARDLFVKSIDIDPRAMDASAYLGLGNLYYRLPGWPFSFGDDENARQYLEAAHKLFPDNIDTNYFYGDYLLQEGQPEKALPYLEKADKAPIRPRMELNDNKLKGEIQKSLAAAREKRTSHSDFFSQFIPDFGGGDAKK